MSGVSRTGHGPQNHRRSESVCSGGHKYLSKLIQGSLTVSHERYGMALLVLRLCKLMSGGQVRPDKT